MPKETPLTGVDLVLADLDGVLYQGQRPITHAVESLRKAGKSAQVGYITNNASRTPASVAEQITQLGLPATADDVVTSPQAALRVLSRLVPAGSLVLVVGGPGLSSEVERAGFRITRVADESPDAVIQGFSPAKAGSYICPGRGVVYLLSEAYEDRMSSDTEGRKPAVIATGM